MWKTFLISYKLINKVLKIANNIKKKKVMEMSIIILLGSVLLLFHEDLIPLKINGYFCSDISLNFPYVPLKKTKFHVVCEGFIFTLFVAVLVELFKANKLKTQVFRKSISLNLKRNLFGKIIFLIIFLLVGYCVNEILINTIKHTIGRLRPYFIDLCNPSVACSINEKYLYIENYLCQKKIHHFLMSKNYQNLLLNARKSFPSGLASYSFYIAIFCSLYIEHRLSKRNEIRLLRHFFQVMVIGWALWVSWGRIENHHNHISDVAAGIFIGSVIATLTFSIFKMKRNEKLYNSTKTTQQYILHKETIHLI